jgi:hypothetical protein
VRRYDDLLDALKTARHSVRSTRSIWCTPATTFETKITLRYGLVLGGAWAPQFIPAEVAGPWHVPYIKTLDRPFIFWSASTKGSMVDWLPAAEVLVKQGASLLLVTENIGDEILRVFIVNSIRGTLGACVVRPSGNSPGIYSELTSGSSGPPRDILKLPRAAEAWIRKRSCVIFDNTNLGSDDLEEIAVIEVGGEDLADQQARVTFLADKLRNEDEESWLPRQPP